MKGRCPRDSEHQRRGNVGEQWTQEAKLHTDLGLSARTSCRPCLPSCFHTPNPTLAPTSPVQNVMPYHLHGPATLVSHLDCCETLQTSFLLLPYPFLYPQHRTLPFLDYPPSVPPIAPRLIFWTEAASCHSHPLSEPHGVPQRLPLFCASLNH